MARAALLLATMLLGCSDPVKDAEQQAEIVRNAGDAAATCEEEKRLAEVYLRAGRAADYRLQKMQANNACLSVELDRLSAEPDDMLNGSTQKR